LDRRNDPGRLFPLKQIINDQDTDNNGDDFVHPKLSIHEKEAKDEESFDQIVQTPENTDDEGNDDASLGLNVASEEGHDAEDDDEELYRDVNINLEVNLDGQQLSSSVSSQFVTSMFNPNPDAGIDSLFETTPRVDVQASTTVAPLTLTAPTLPLPTIPAISQVPQAPTPPTTAPSTFLQDLPNFGLVFGFDHRLKTLEANFSEFIETNQFAGAVSFIPRMVERYMDQRMNKDVKTGGQREEENEKSQSQQALKRERRPRPLASLLKDSNLIKRLQASVADDQPIAEASQHPEWFQIQKKPPTPDRAWNKTLPAAHISIQPWISDLAKQADSRSSFNELMDTPMDFSAFLMNRPKVDTLTHELLAGPTYELMQGSCKSLVELEFFLEEVYKATTDQLDWNNPEGQQYPHNLLKPLPLMPNSRGRRVIPFDHFINNDLEYLRGGTSSRKYTTSVTKTKAADYGHIKESLIGGANINSSMDLQSTGSLLEMSTQNIESSLSPNFRSSNGIIKSIWIRLRKAEKSHGRRTLCFQLLSKNVHKKHRHPTACVRSSTSDETLNDGTLNDVQTALDDHLKGIQIKYLPQDIWRKSDKERAAAMIQAINKQLKTRRIMRSLEKFVGGRLYERYFRILQRTI
nr:hypothetical protein [Tanacetum cinerariifolium]